MPRERRRHPRVPTDLAARIVNLHTDRALSGRLMNLSLGGVLIRGDTGIRNHLQGDPDVFPVQAEISFELPQGAVRLTCRHIHTRRLSVQQFELGFKTLEFHDRSAEHLQGFVDRYFSAH